MNHLLPCPSCQRHVRKSEGECPFCGASLDLSGAPAPVLPRTRLGRAATFAFGATLALTACGETEDGDDGQLAGAAGVGASGGASSSGGAAAKGGSAGNTFAGTGGSSVQPVYGAPATGGTFNETGGSNGAGGSTAGAGGTGTAGQNTAGTANSNVGGSAMPVYGAAPAD